MPRRARRPGSTSCCATDRRPRRDQRIVAGDRHGTVSAVQSISSVAGTTRLPGTSGLAAIPLLREEVPQAQVLMLTVSEDAEDLIDALHAGARGYLLKNIETDFLLQSIRSAARGESVMSPQMSGKLADAMRAPPQSPTPTPSNCTGCHLNPIPSQPPTTTPAQDLNKLSAREREIIIMLARGVSNKEIARDLDLAESTIKIHVQGILRKLNLTSRVQAAVYAVKNGLVSEA